jgi:DNA repair and recombination protein RAD54 and RAD54-like protein
MSPRLVTMHMCILQVSFVFTNQVDGKLVPVESMVRSAAHQQNGIAATGEKGVQIPKSPSKPGKQSLNGKNLKMGFHLKNSSLKCSTKSRPSPNCLQGLMKTSPFLDQPQIKKLHVASDISDDDFV